MRVVPWILIVEHFIGDIYIHELVFKSMASKAEARRMTSRFFLLSLGWICSPRLSDQIIWARIIILNFEFRYSDIVRMIGQGEVMRTSIQMVNESG